jgi:hypothetical protein
MGRISKIEKHEEERDRSGKLKKTRWKVHEERKRRVFYIPEGFHTGVFSIGWEDPWATALMHPTSREPTHMGTSPYNFKLSLVFQYCLSV